MASQITSLTIVYSTVYSGADERKHQSSASLAFVRGIHRWPVNSPHKGPVTRKMFPFDDVIMTLLAFGREIHTVHEWPIMRKAFPSHDVIMLQTDWLSYHGAMGINNAITLLLMFTVIYASSRCSNKLSSRVLNTILDRSLREIVVHFLAPFTNMD